MATLDPPFLGNIVRSLCEFAEVDSPNTTVIDAIPVRGFVAAGGFSVAAALRILQGAYFFDLPEIDGKLVAILRGGSIVETINRLDMVEGALAKLETAREQGVEFPYKLHIAFKSAETDYTPTKATSERRSVDVEALTEVTIQLPINLLPDESIQLADKTHKVAWAEQEGIVKFSIPEIYARFVPSNLLLVEVFDSIFKRCRIQKITFVEGMIQIESVVDRVSSYQSALSTNPVVAPIVPPSNLPGATIWEYMDLPALLTAHDSLHYYVAGYGDNVAWSGAQIQREIAGDFTDEAQILEASIMGVVAEALPLAPAEYTDTLNTLLVTTNEALFGVTTDDILKGANGALVGDEIIQFRDVVAEGDDWRLSHLTRGRLNTTPALHAIDDRFVYLGNPVLVPVDVVLLDTTLTLRAASFGTTPDGAGTGFSFTGRSQTEWAPVSLVANQNGNDWVFSWTPRARMGSSANPVVAIRFQGWRLRFTVGGTIVHHDTVDPTMVDPTYTYTEADQITDFGSAQSTLDVEIMGLNSLTGEGDDLSETV